MIVLDATVLTNAVGKSRPLREPARRLVAAVGDKQLDLRTTVEVIQEVAQVRSRRRTREDAVDLARRYAVLAATAIARHAEAMISAESAFASVPGLPFVDLASEDWTTWSPDTPVPGYHEGWRPG
ncbi:MAG: PIN domain-containing protein [Actinomycetota bacterium]|nr:PIN domain-containing protein [Actinomycetota bacterium]